MSADQTAIETSPVPDDVVFEALEEVVAVRTEETEIEADPDLSADQTAVETPPVPDEVVFEDPEEVVTVPVQGTEPEADADSNADMSEDTDTVTEPAESPRKPGFLGLLKSPIGLIGAAVLAAALGGAGFIFATSGGNDKAAEEITAEESDGGYETAATESADAPKEKLLSDVVQAEPNTFDNEYGTVTFSGDSAIYHTAPATISIDSGPNSRRLRVSVGVLTDPETAKSLYADGLAVSVLKIEAVESVDFGPYREWELPGLIVSAFKTRLEGAYPETEIRAVIIRDFERV
ncbi:MAG: hypothetical protein ACE37M_13490 [Henriciella sp.]